MRRKAKVSEDLEKLSVADAIDEIGCGDESEIVRGQRRKEPHADIRGRRTVGDRGLRHEKPPG